MESLDRERLKALLSDELGYITRQLVSSDKTLMEDEVAKWVIRDLTRNGHTYQNGVTKRELIQKISESNINKFSQVVAGANSEEKFIKDVTDLLPMAYRKMTWRKIERCFGLQWKFNFPFPRHLYDKKVNARTYTKREKKIKDMKELETPDPLTLIPIEIREMIQKISDANELQKKTDLMYP